MSQKVVLFLFIFLLLAISYKDSVSYSTGPPDGCTGAPADGITCVVCHSGSPVTVLPNLISTNIPLSGYVPGATYAITATIAGQGHTIFGFQLTSQDTAGNTLGSFMSTSGETQTAQFGRYISHTSSGVAGTNSRTWTFDWTAPLAGSGYVNFWGAFNVSDANHGPSGDTIYTSVLTVFENPVETFNLKNNSNKPWATFSEVEQAIIINRTPEGRELKYRIFSSGGLLIDSGCLKPSTSKGFVKISLHQPLQQGMYIISLNYDDNTTAVKCYAEN